MALHASSTFARWRNHCNRRRGFEIGIECLLVFVCFLYARNFSNMSVFGRQNKLLTEMVGSFCGSFCTDYKRLISFGVDQYFCAKFGTVMENRQPKGSQCSEVGFSKIQDGRRPPFWISILGRNFGVAQHYCAKFGTVMENR